MPVRRASRAATPSTTRRDAAQHRPSTHARGSRAAAHRAPREDRRAGHAAAAGRQRYMTWINAGRRADVYARELYVNLRTLDKSGAQRDPGRGSARRAKPGTRCATGCAARPRPRTSSPAIRTSRRCAPTSATTEAAVARRASRSSDAALVAQHGSPLLLLDCDGRPSPVPQRCTPRCPGSALYYALKPLPHSGGGRRAARARRHASTWRPSGEIRLVQGGRDRARALHPHAPDQDRRRHPRRAALRHPHLRGRQSRRDPQVPARTGAAPSCCCAVVPRSRRRWSTCRASSVASPQRRRRRCSTLAQGLGVRCAGCRSTSVRRSPSRRSTSRRSAPARELIANGAARRASPTSTCSTSAAAFRSPTAARCRRSASSAADPPGAEAAAAPACA